MTNLQRGEAVIEIDGAAHTLRFTLGALAELEQALDASDGQGISTRLKTLSAADLQAVLTALLRAGGASDPQACAAAAEPRAAAKAVAACIKANRS